MAFHARPAILAVFVTLFGLPMTFAAEVRTWNAAAGGFSVQATFVELKAGDVVHLKTNDGRDLDVPLAQLSDADRQYVRQQGAGAAPGGASPRWTKTQRAADRCRMPSDALVIYQVFQDDPQTADAERRLAAAKIAEMKDLAAKKLVRLNKKWVPAAESDAVRKQADELMRQGLELLKLSNEAGFRQKFAAAAALEPEEIRADFLAALIYTRVRAYEKAEPIFQKCLARDPENVIVMNNLALVAVAQHDWTTAAAQWRRALDVQPDQRIVHNIGRYLEQMAESILLVPKSARDALAFPYAELIASGKFDATDEELGWLFLYIEASALNIDLRDDKEEEPVDVAPAATEDGYVVGGGTGFVVSPGYVLTNAHVAMDDATFEIQLGDGKLLKATRVAKAENLDLALLKCEELAAPALPLSAAMAPRGTDVMLLGYPSMTTLGVSLKATRGSISSLPDASGNDHYLYDAASNSGNSGGPLCDDRGNVIAVHFIGTNTATRYGGGIPSPKALEFVRTALPDFQPAAAKTEKLDWPTVDANVSPSTLLIWVRKKNAAATEPVATDFAEIRLCLFCQGEGKSRCSAPGCVKGQLIRSGKRFECPICSGKGMSKCNVCDGVGFDVRLASVQAALKKASEARPPSNSTKPARPSTDPAKQPATGQAVELLPLIDLAKHKVHGEWSVEDGKLIGGGENSSRVQIPYEPPAEYDVHVTAQLLNQGDGGLIMGLVSGSQQFYISLREDGCGISAGGVINNEYKQTGEKYPLTQPTNITFMVRHRLITVLYQGNPAYYYRDDQTKLRLASTMTMPNPRELFIGSGGPGLKWSISRIMLVPVVGGPPPGEVVAPNGHRYKFVKEKVSWTEAKAKCEAMGGYLACFATQEEHLFLGRSLPPSTASESIGNKYWIGGFVRDGRWQWLTGEPFQYSPNSPQADAQRPYLRLLGDTGRWLGFEDRTGLTEGFICEWNK